MITRRAPPFGLFERMLAGRYLFARRKYGGVALISAISVIAITLAVAALVITMSVMNGFRGSMVTQIIGAEGHIFVDVRDLAPAERDALATQIRDHAEVVSVEPIITSQALIDIDGRSSGVIVRGMSREALSRIPLISSNMAAGTLAGFEGIDAPTIVLGGQLAAGLGAYEGMSVNVISPNASATPFGLTPRQKSFLIGAIFQTGVPRTDTGIVYLPFDQARILFGRGQAADELEIRIRDLERADRVAEQLRRMIGPDRDVADWKLKSEGMADALAVERNVMRLILMILIAISSLNVITGLLMLVKNKSRDVAILRTMGASRGAILRVFFMASASLGVIGLACGMLIGLGVALNIEAIQGVIEMMTGAELLPGSAFQSLPAKVDWVETIVVGLFTLAVTFGATLITASWASRADPVESLRYD
jgi:lipoprotein-releasing system permease protein